MVLLKNQVAWFILKLRAVASFRAVGPGEVFCDRFSSSKQIPIV